MAFPRIGGSGVALNLTGAVGGLLPSASNVFTGAAPTNAVNLNPGQQFMLPAGTYMVAPGSYTSLQFLDPVTGLWRSINSDNSEMPHVIDSDGGNFRLANLTGCPVGAMITNNGGANGTNGIGSTATGLTVTPSTGGSVWSPIVGGAVGGSLAGAGANGILTIPTGQITAGSGYTIAPQLLVQAPPAGGIQCTMTVASMSGGGISSVIVTNPGAGYTTAPTIQVVNDIRDTTGAGAVVTATIGSSSSCVTGLLCTNNGQPFGVNAVTGTFNAVAATNACTLTFSTGTAAATVMFNYCLVGWTVSVAGGTASLSGTNVLAIGYDSHSGLGTFATAGIASVSATFSSNIAGLGLMQQRVAVIAAPVLAAGTTASSASCGVILDNGFGFTTAVGTQIAILPGGGTIPVTTGSLGSLAAQVGGVGDTSYIQPI